MYFVFVQLLSSGSAWFAIILIVVACLFLDVVKKVLYRHLQPTSTEKAQVTLCFYIQLDQHVKKTHVKICLIRSLPSCDILVSPYIAVVF